MIMRVSLTHKQNYYLSARSLWQIYPLRWTASSFWVANPPNAECRPRSLCGSLQLNPEPTPLANSTLSYRPSAPPPKSSSAFLPAPPLYFKPSTLTKLSSSVLSKCPSQRSLFLRITVDIPSAPTSF